MIPPTLVRPEVMRGTGFLGQHADEVYKLEADDLYLVGTSEVPLAGYHMGEILDLTAGAKRYAGWSTCYRREAGSYGKDTRGIIRVHQFNKLEMFVYTTPDDAEAEHPGLGCVEHRLESGLGAAAISGELGGLGLEQQGQRLLGREFAGVMGVAASGDGVAGADRDHAARHRLEAARPAARP